ncbi:ABC transporter ATP-binding protein, partial [Bittarella massiliensis]|nr:ABC transporter ATP-binding protein [Bittarella massiliensis (ex Durand et al. 2017)]
FSHSEMNEIGVASLISRTNNDAFQIMMFMNVILRTAVLTPVMIVVSFMLTVRTSLNLSLIIISTIPLIIIGVIIV